MWCGVVYCSVKWRRVERCKVMWYGMVWCGVEWCGVVWRGVVWCGVEWCGVEWSGVEWCGVESCGVVWCGGVVSCVIRYHCQDRGRNTIQTKRCGHQSCDRTDRSSRDRSQMALLYHEHRTSTTTLLLV